MQDDIYLIAVDSWKAELSLVKGKKDEYECDLIPKSFIINCYFLDDLKSSEQLESERDEITGKLEELVEEQSGDDGLLEEVKSDKGKISKGAIQKRLKEINNSSDDTEELKALETYLNVLEKEAELNKKIKEAQVLLNNKVLNKYSKLTEDEIKSLVVDDKWITKISSDVKGEMDRISQRLTQRIKELDERYEKPLRFLTAEVTCSESKVKDHLNKMGFKWK